MGAKATRVAKKVATKRAPRANFNLGKYTSVKAMRSDVSASVAWVRALGPFGLTREVHEVQYNGRNFTEMKRNYKRLA